MRVLLLAAFCALPLCAAAKFDGCADWCRRWTCGDTKFCGGCDEKVCKGDSPHPMCYETEQPHCKAPRCEKYCTDSMCGNAMCSGCKDCRRSKKGVATALRASPNAIAVEEIEDDSPKPTCDESNLRLLKSDLQAKVDAQKARNAALRAAVAPGESAPSMATSTLKRADPAALECLQVGQQCGGHDYTGSTTCCQNKGSPVRVCKKFSDFFSGCREVTDD